MNKLTMNGQEFEVWECSDEHPHELGYAKYVLWVKPMMDFEYYANHMNEEGVIE